MSLTKVSYSLINGACINVKDFGAVCDKTTNDTAAVQAAIDYALANGIQTIEVPGMCLIKSSLVINRNVANYPLTDKGEFFFIKSDNNGGFYTDVAIPLFTTTLPYTADPVSQLVCFDKLRFEVSATSVGAYILDENKFLRMRFNRCDIIKIQLLSAVGAGKYLQSYYFEGCNIRDWENTWLNSTNWNFDLHFNMNIVEHSYGSFLIMKSPQGCSVTNNVMESIQGSAVQFYASKSISITGNYFESNTDDIYMTSADPNYGIHIAGNRLGAPVTWGTFTYGGISIGNEGDTASTLHNLEVRSDVLIRDVNHGGGATTPFTLATNALYNTGPVSRQSKYFDVAASGAKQFDFELEDSCLYLVCATELNGANAIYDSGMWLVSKNGTGTNVAVVKAATYFTVGIFSGKISLNNTDGANNRICNATTLRLY